jgi:hypothetical protein
VRRLLRLSLGPKIGHDLIAAETTLVRHGEQSQEGEGLSLGSGTRERPAATLYDGSANVFRRSMALTSAGV